ARADRRANAPARPSASPATAPVSPKARAAFRTLAAACWPDCTIWNVEPMNRSVVLLGRNVPSVASTSNQDARAAKAPAPIAQRRAGPTEAGAGTTGAVPVAEDGVAGWGRARTSDRPPQGRLSGRTGEGTGTGREGGARPECRGEEPPGRAGSR